MASARRVPWAIATLLALLSAGCGSGSSTGTAPGTPPAIVTQPSDASVPMGLTATYSVVASGSNLSYQWSRNGTALQGATGSSYSTPATAFSDTGETFTVKISNAAGSVTSRAANLSVTARAPKAGDLRFQQVDAPTTINGYQEAGLILSSVECPPPGGGGTDLSISGAAGGTFSLINNPCEWQFFVYGTPSTISTAYEVDYVSNLQSDLTQSIAGIPPPSDPGSVVISAGMTSAYSSIVSFGYVHGSTSSGFDMQQTTVAATNFPVAAVQEGQHGRIITALFVNGSQITYFSYGWTGDTGSIYEIQAVPSTLDNAVANLTTLASEGYIVTATTSTEAADGSGLWLVGARLQGDTMPRPILSVSEPNYQQIFSGGYALVARVTKINSSYATVIDQLFGER